MRILIGVYVGAYLIVIWEGFGKKPKVFWELPDTNTSMSTTTPTLPWTGERMIPFVSDYATQATHWQRYLYFRPWYEDAVVVDAACGEGYGTDYASIFAKSATGADISKEATDFASSVYPTATYVTKDCCDFDYSGADLVISFETIEHLPDPEKFLEAVKACQGRIVISTPNRKLYDPHAKLGDKPTNPYHTIEWTAEEFAELIHKHFPDRQVRFLTQSPILPGYLHEGLDPDGWFIIAVIGDGELPQWPKLGFAMPTVNNATQGIECISAFVTYYPGPMEFAVVLNGTDEDNTTKWKQFASSTPGFVHILENAENTGYGAGANKGLAYLQKKGGFDAFGVTNDDVYPSLGCLSELSYAMLQLQNMDQKPGLLGVVSNKVAGKQLVELNGFNDLPSMMRTANNYLRTTKSSATPWPQIRGLCFLMTPECLSAIGGFDPIFGLGNFEDDDLNLRAKLAGFTTWIVDGAWLYHEGSQTFQQLEIDYDANIQRNMAVFGRKWGIEHHVEFITLEKKPEGTSLYVPLDAQFVPVHNVVINTNGETVDLIHQASDMEFSYWVFAQLRAGGVEVREQILDSLKALEAKYATAA